MNASALGSQVRMLLAAQGRFAPGSLEIRWSTLLACIVLGGLFYGACMGSWQLRPQQQLYSALKTPLLISAGGLFCLPSFYVINTILGLRDDLPMALRGVLASQAATALCLASLGPIVATLYTGTQSYPMATAWNGIFFLLASLGGQVVMQRHYQSLIKRNPKHRLGLYAWLFTFWFVTIQLAWMLRPFIGNPGDVTTFFRKDKWGNAYVQVWDVISKILQ